MISTLSPLKNKTPLPTHFFFLLSFAFHCSAQNAGNVTILDSKHYSTVFGEVRNYRIFLPPGYFGNLQKKYPVIYFLHGWSQRYFGDGAQGQWSADKGDQNKGDNIANFVSNHDAIVVKSDGYNRGPEESYYVRPYNIAPVETFRQFPIYFPELIDYIDTHYRTLADREHRAISGLSMGGFMSFWIGGKYPHLFSAAGNFCGSVELEVGPRNFPVEYRHIDMYKNYAGMNVRLNYGNKDFIRSYHQDMDRIWPQVMDNYESNIYDADHSSCGLAEMFGFFLKTFDHPPPRPLRWDHVDVYPEFSVWDYQVSSDRNVPGFTILENVDKRGFRCTVREFVPDGEIIPSVNLSVTTAPVYEKNQIYTIHDIDLKSLKTIRQTILSDPAGRLRIDLHGGVHEIGINKTKDKPIICIAAVQIENMSWATLGKEVVISIKLVNKGMSDGKNITARLSATRKSANVTRSSSEFGSITVNEIKGSQVPFAFQVQTDSIEIEKFELAIQDENRNEWTEFFELPLKRNLPEIKDFEIADGRIFSVAKAGNDIETLLLGNGNGDGIANPGESIVILVKDMDKYWRTNLSFSDKYVNPFGTNIRKSDDWSDFDWVGASAKYSVPVLSSNCPENHNIEFFVEYWLPNHPLHIKKQGVIKIGVKGNDKTAPKIGSIHVQGDNTLQVKIYDGSKIQLVKARLILKDDPAKSFEIELKDDGMAEDRVEGDNLFSKRIPEQRFGFYRVVVEAMDSFGNKIMEESPDQFVLY